MFYEFLAIELIIVHPCMHHSYSSISNFTLHYLEDTGWYKVNYAVAESLHFYEFLWGKGVINIRIILKLFTVVYRIRL